MISSLASKWQVLKFGMPIFQPLYEVKLKVSKFKSWPFEASEDIITKFKSQALPIENCHLCTNNKIFITILHTTVA